MKALGNALGVIEPVDTDDLHAIEDRRLQARCILARLIAGRHLGELLGIDADRKCLGHHRAAVGAQTIAIRTAARFAQYVIPEALNITLGLETHTVTEIGRATWRERVGQYR